MSSPTSVPDPLQDGEVDQLLEQLVHLSGTELQALLDTPSIEWN